MKGLSAENISKLKKIKLVITDVDGVLTDGGLYYTKEGLVMKKFNVKDGLGARKLRDFGIKTAIISTDTSEIISKRAERIKIDFVYTGIWEKEQSMQEICSQINITPANAAFIGDDTNDIGIIEAAGFTACPNDSVDEIKNRVDLICNKNGGGGVFRELADLILNVQAK